MLPIASGSAELSADSPLFSLGELAAYLSAYVHPSHHYHLAVADKISLLLIDIVDVLYNL